MRGSFDRGEVLTVGWSKAQAPAGPQGGRDVIAPSPDQQAEAGRRDVAFGWRIVDVLVAIGRKVSLGRARGVLPYLLILPAAMLIGLLAAGVGYMMWLGFHSFELAREQRLVARQLPTAVHRFRGGVVPQRARPHDRDVDSRHDQRGDPRRADGLHDRAHAGAVWRRVALVMLLVPFLMGETVRTIGWVLLLGNEGALTWMSRGLGHEIKLLGCSVAVWLGMLQVMFPIATLVMLPAVRRINPDLERAARTMGARPWHVWRRIVVPVRPAGDPRSVARRADAQHDRVRDPQDRRSRQASRSWPTRSSRSTWTEATSTSARRSARCSS